MTSFESLAREALSATPQQLDLALKILRGDNEVRPDVEPYCTARQTAKAFGVSTTSLWRWKVPGHLIGGRKRYRLTEVRDFLEMSKVQTAACMANDDGERASR